MSRIHTRVAALAAGLAAASSSLIATSAPAHAATTYDCQGNVPIYGVMDNNSLTFSLVDSHTGTFNGVVNSGSYTLPFTPRSIATLNYNTILAVSTDNKLWRIDVKTVNGTVALMGAPTVIGDRGWTHRTITVDGAGHLFGLAGNTLMRYDIAGKKPTAATNRTVIDTGFSLKTLTATAPNWLMGTTDDGKLITYRINGTDSWVRHDLSASTWGGFDLLTAAGDGFFLAKKGGALTSYYDSDPTNGKADLHGNVVSDSGWAQKLISAVPTSATCAAGPVSVDTSSHDQLIATAGPLARATDVATGVPAAITLAQAIQESAWGASGLTRNYHNWFGIKCSSTPSQYQSGCVTLSTHEVVNGKTITVQAKFRTYANDQDSFMDHAYFLKNGSRYAPCFQTSTDADFARALQKAGYATDPNYASTLISLMTKYNLGRFDA